MSGVLDVAEAAAASLASCCCWVADVRLRRFITVFFMMIGRRVPWSLWYRPAEQMERAGRDGEKGAAQVQVRSLAQSYTGAITGRLTAPSSQARLGSTQQTQIDTPKGGRNRNVPQALQILLPSSSRRQRGVVFVPQLVHTSCDPSFLSALGRTAPEPSAPAAEAPDAATSFSDRDGLLSTAGSRESRPRPVPVPAPERALAAGPTRAR